MSNRSLCVFSKVPGLARGIASKLPDISITDIKLIPSGEAKIQYKKPSKEDLEKIQQAEILVTDPGLIADNNLAQNLHKLKWMHSTWAGNDAIFKSLDTTKPLPSYKLTRSGGQFGQSMMEYVLAQIIVRERQFGAMKEDQCNKLWGNHEKYDYREVSDLTLGILGVGDIGKHVARGAKTFGMQVWGLVRTIPEQSKQVNVDEYRTIQDLPELLSSCDYICNILPNTSATVGLLNKDMLQYCKKKKAVFINVGRGNIIEEEQILHALKNGWISHAILDVFESEPLPKNSPLWDHPDVTITPHVAALSRAKNTTELFLDNYQRYTEGKTLLFETSWDTGY